MKTSGPCLCGDPYCPSCGDPGAAKLEEAAEALLNAINKAKATEETYRILIAIIPELSKAIEKEVDARVKEARADEQMAKNPAMGDIHSVLNSLEYALANWGPLPRAWVLLITRAIKTLRERANIQ